jgi:hypothetical protein
LSPLLPLAPPLPPLVTPRNSTLTEETPPEAAPRQIERQGGRSSAPRLPGRE